MDSHLVLSAKLGWPISRSFFARYGIPRISTFCRLGLKAPGLPRWYPHLAKNERDVGPPGLCYWWLLWRLRLLGVGDEDIALGGLLPDTDGS
jgi:hypothetical protein